MTKPPILKALLKKNYRLKRSKPCASCSEVLLPLALVLAFTLLKAETEIFNVPEGWSDETETCPFPVAPEAKNKSCSYPYASFVNDVPSFDALSRSELNIDGHPFAKVFLAYEDEGGDSAKKFMDDFQSWGFSGSDTNHMSLFNASTFVFKSGKESEVEEYVKSKMYARPFDASNPEVAGLIVFQESNLEENKYNYKIRLNSTGETLAGRFTGGESTYDVSRQLFTRNLRTFSERGHMSLQLLVDQYLIGQGALDNEYMPYEVQTLPFPVREYDNDEFFALVNNVFALLYILCFLWPVAQLVSALVTEKETRMREMMKMMGVNDSQLFGSWYITYIVFFFILALAITITSSALFPSSSANGISFFIFLLFFLFGIATMALCYMLSAFFWKSRTASIASVTIYFVGFFFYFQVNSVSQPKPAVLLLIPQVAFSLGIQTIGSLEGAGAGVNWGNADLLVNGFAFQNSIIMLAFDFFFYTFLGWYFNYVIRQEFGKPQPFYFFLQPSFWGFNSNTVADDTSSDDYKQMDSDTIQPVGTHLLDQIRTDRCVQIKGLRKTFDAPGGEKVAVKGLHLNMYEGQILALLGHNGAGKTTTLSCLAGMLTPTSGTAVVRGNDIRSQMDEVRQSLGFCPQHDVLYKELTVKQHLEFYGSVKGLRGDALKNAVLESVKEVGLTEKLNARSKSLSGGQKRKLSVAIALIGDSKVIFLDEPTSGMDPYSRRSTWELLQNSREGRVMVLTTHFMDEADILGDRIAIMAEGELRCEGDSLFLKTRFGEGYTLTIVKQQHCNESVLKDLVLNSISDAKLLSNVGAEIVFQLPIEHTSEFPALFTKLDADKEKLKIDQYGISVTTMEEVFLKVASSDEAAHAGLDMQKPERIVETQSKDENEDVSIAVAEEVQSDLNNMFDNSSQNMFWRHFFTLYKKRYRYAKRDFKSCCCIAALPVVLIAFGLSILTFTGFGADEFPIQPTIADYNPKFPNDDVRIPFVELNEYFEPVNTVEGTVFNSQFFDEKIQLSNVLLDGNKDSLSFGKTETVFGRNYVNGIPTDCENPNAECTLPAPETGASILSLGKHVLEQSEATSLNGTSMYLAAVLEKRPLPRKSCNVLNFESLLSSASSGSIPTNEVVCAVPEDKCLYLELSLPLEGVNFPGISLDKIDICAPVGCSLDALSVYNPATLEVLLQSLTGGIPGGIPGGLPGGLPGDGNTDIPDIDVEEIINDIAFFTCEGDRCNVAPNLLALLSGSNCRGDTKAGQDKNDVCILPNLEQVVPSEDYSKFTANSSAVYCGDDESRRLLDEESQRLLDEDIMFDSRFDERFLADNCSPFNSTTCGAVDGCKFYVDEDSCLVDCAPVTTNATCSSLSHCSWDSFCSYDCGRLTTEDSCSDAFATYSVDCIWDDNSCSLRKRYSYISMVNSTSKWGGIISMNLIDSALLKMSADNKDAAITVTTHPLPYTQNLDVLITGFKGFTMAIFIVIAYAFVPASVMGYVVMEKEKVKHQQFVSGVGPLPYWSSMFAFDMTTFLFPMIATLLLVVLFEVDSFTDDGAFGCLIVILIGYGLAVMPFTYTISHLFEKHTTAQNLALLINLLTGLVLMVASFVLDQLENTKEANASLKYLYRIFPGFCLGDSFQNLAIRSIISAFLFQLDDDAEVQSPYELELTGYNIIYLYMSFIGWALLAISIDIVKAYPKIWSKVFRDPEGNKKPGDLDVDVAAEKERVMQMGSTKDIVTIENLRKVYRNGKVAVNNVTLGIPQGECFGYLGINGAGKTSTMKCLTGDVNPSEGTAYLNGLDIQYHAEEVRRLIGYCPQFDALLDLLSVREHLELYANIKGIKKDQIESMIKDKMQELTLTEFENVYAKNLSGGNRRKLSVAIAMIGKPPIMFLDEPSTGMDPVSRRFMWRVIADMSAGDSKTAVVLTTHSMEECEALCSRVGIMIGGGLQCLGSVQHLKSRFGSGLMFDVTVDQPSSDLVDAAIKNASFKDDVSSENLSAVIAKFAANESEVVARLALIEEKNDSAWPIWRALDAGENVPIDVFTSWWLLQSRIDQLVSFLDREFPGYAIIETHESHMRLRVPKSSLEKQGLGNIFALFESKKAELHLSEYSVSQTSLEQIFNQFAATQEEEQGVARGFHMEAVLSE